MVFMLMLMLRAETGVPPDKRHKVHGKMRKKGTLHVHSTFHSAREEKTFTFTFICHPGKTHNHRSRGDAPWKAQTKPSHSRRRVYSSTQECTCLAARVALSTTSLGLPPRLIVLTTCMYSG